MPALIVFIFLVVLMFSCLKVVPQATEYVIERLGKYQKTWGAGLHFLIPIIDRVSKRVTLKEQVLDSPPQPVITKDNVTTALGYTPPTTNTTYSVVSTSADGLAPKRDGSTTKFLRADGTWAVPPDNNTVYTHPTTSGNKHIPSGGSSGQILRWSADGTAVWGNDNNTTYSAATTSAAGLMSASDKSKLDGIASGANKITVDSALSSSSTNPVQNKAVYTAINNIKGVPSCTTSNNGQFLRVVNGVATWSTISSAEGASF